MEPWCSTRTQFGLGAGSIGALSALLTFLFAIGALVGGRLGDRFGRRKVFTVTMIGLAVGIAVMAGAQNVAMLYIGDGASSGSASARICRCRWR